VQAQLKQESDARLKQAINVELKRLRQMDDRQRQRQLGEIKRSIQESLTLRCPGCSCMVGRSVEGPFFSACAAIQCGRCRVYFCGLCLEGCGRAEQGAHQHVTHCSKKTAGMRDFLFPGDIANKEGACRQHWAGRTARMVTDVLAAACMQLEAVSHML